MFIQKKCIGIVCTLSAVFTAVLTVSCSDMPDYKSFNFFTPISRHTAAPGRTISGRMNATITRQIPMADVMFAMDLTGSMDPSLTWFSNNSVDLLNDLNSVIADPRYGVITFKDYPINPYGDTGDQPYHLALNLTDDNQEVQNIFNQFTTGGGNDSPESYTRVLYESYSDPAIAYRPGTRKFLILIGDDIPHDDDLLDGYPGGLTGTGGATTTEDRMQTYLSNGNGSFQDPVYSSGSGSQATRFYFADINGDHRADKLSWQYNGSGGQVAVYGSNGDGTFQDPVYSIGSVSATAAFYFADVDGDGRADKILWDYANNGGQIIIRLSNGDGSFGDPIYSPCSASATTQLFFADINGDGSSDRLLWNYNASSGAVLASLSNGDGSFEDPSASASSAGSTASGSLLFFTDIDNNGSADKIIITPRGDNTAQATLSLSNGDGSFTDIFNLPQPLSNSAKVYFADVSGDGLADMIIWDYLSPYGGKIEVHVSEGDGNFKSPVYSTGSLLQTARFYFADINGNGAADKIHWDIITSGNGINTGVDPGRDGVIGTPDDLDHESVILGMIENNITLLTIFTKPSSTYFQYWLFWSSATGGGAFNTDTADDLSASIKDLLDHEATNIDRVSLQITTPGYESWLTEVTPSAYTDLHVLEDRDLSFEYRITVPTDACSSGVNNHTFTLSVIADGAVYNNQEMDITVSCR